jgi:antitoxin component YwqK of YwqJK toxin-antitoxin module
MAKKKSAKKKITKKKTAGKRAAKKPAAKAAKAHNCESCGGGCSGPQAGPQGILHGMYISFDPESGIYVESNYDNGLEHGEHIEYYDIDTEFIKTRGNYFHGLKEGQWIHYKKDGAVEKIEKYVNGRKKN